MSLLEVLQEMGEKKAALAAVTDPKVFGDLPGALAAFAGMWPPSSSFTDVLRASQIHDVCPRQFVMNYWHPTASVSFDLKSHLMMNMGSFLHEFLQNCVLGPMLCLKGNWKHSQSGQVVKDSFHPDPEDSIRCVVNQEPVNWQFQEQRLFHALYRIAGHTDGILSIDRIQWLSQNLPLVKKSPKEAFKQLAAIPSGEEAIGEIKTTGSFVFNALERPDQIAPYYKSQASVYQALTGIPKTVFWYVSRDTMTSKFLLYVGEKAHWNEAKSKARVIWEAIRDERLPEAFNACKLPSDKRAKTCPFKSECFATGGRFDMARFVQAAKARAAQEGRKLLDLSKVEFPA